MLFRALDKGLDKGPPIFVSGMDLATKYSSKVSLLIATFFPIKLSSGSGRCASRGPRWAPGRTWRNKHFAWARSVSPANFKVALSKPQEPCCASTLACPRRTKVNNRTKPNLKSKTIKDLFTSHLRLIQRICPVVSVVFGSVRGAILRSEFATNPWLTSVN